MPSKFQCQSCFHLVPLSPDYTSDFHGQHSCEECGARHVVRLHGGSIADFALRDRIPKVKLNVPKAIADDFEEAVLAFNAGAPRAAAVMMRRALEAACGELGATGSTLAEKIRSLNQKQNPRTGSKIEQTDINRFDAARIFGNQGAHSPDDPLNDLTVEDAYGALNIGKKLLEKLFP